MQLSVTAQVWAPSLGWPPWLAASGGAGDDSRERGDGPARHEGGAARTTQSTEIHLLGTFRVLTSGEQRVELSGVPAEVLKLVALRRRVHVEEVTDIVWPGLDVETGRRRLRNVLSRLRAACGDVVRREQHALALAEDVVVDAHRFEAYAQEARVRGADDPEGLALAGSAVALYHGDLLPGDVFRDWTVAARERLRRRFVDVLDLLADAAAARGDVDEALLLLEKGIELEAYDEQRYLRAAQVLLEADRRGAAAMALRRAGAMLDELGLMPSARYREIEERLRTG